MWPYKVIADHVLVALVITQAYFPAPPVAWTPHIGRRPGPVACLDGKITEIGPVGCQLYIDNKPAFPETKVFPRTVKGMAHHRTRTISPDNKMGAYLRFCAVLCEIDRHSVIILHDPGNSAPAHHLYCLLSGQTVIQVSFQIGLMKAIAGIPAKGTDLLRARPVKQQVLVLVDKARAAIHPDLGVDLVGKLD